MVRLMLLAAAPVLAVCPTSAFLPHIVSCHVVDRLSRIGQHRLSAHKMQFGRLLRLAREAVPSLGVETADVADTRLPRQQSRMLVAEHFSQDLISDWITVLLGAWGGASGQVFRLQSSVLFKLLVLISCVSVASRMQNDLLDIVCDTVNNPLRPLPGGAIDRKSMVLWSCILAVLALGATCAIEHAVLRTWIGLGLLAVTLYTPCLKPLPAVKNLVVAAVLTGAFLLGAFAVGLELQNLHGLVAPSTYLFCFMTIREVLCDIGDVQGDYAANVLTLPVVFGRKKALRGIAALAILTFMMPAWTLLQGVVAIMQGRFIASMWLWLTACMTTYIWVCMGAFYSLWNVAQSQFAQPEILSCKAALRYATLSGLAIMVLTKFSL